MTKLIKVDAQLVKESQDVLDDIGIEVETVVRMALKRVVKDKSIAFLMAQTEKAEVPREQVQLPVSPQPAYVADDNRMTKSLAVSLFEREGVRFNRNITFASKNRAAYNYWANPYFFALKQDWFLILNDWNRRELHLFVIPANAILATQLVARTDIQEKIDLQISYGDPTFTDNRSKIKFQKYWIKSIKY